MAKSKNEAIGEFISAFTKVCNESQILYCDMIYQEDLFDFQEKVIDALLEANRDKLFTTSELLKFNHIFGITK